MSSRSAMARIAASETQPPLCSCTRHMIAITAEACRPGGYFSICFFAQARFSSVKAKLAACCSFGARRRTDIRFKSLLRSAARGARIQAVNTVFPERARGAEHVVTDVRRDLDAVEDREFCHGFETVAARIVDDQLQRRLFEDVARHRMGGIVAMLLAEDRGIALQQPGSALDGLDFDALDVELDQVFSVR